MDKKKARPKKKILRWFLVIMSLPLIYVVVVNLFYSLLYTDSFTHIADSEPYNSRGHFRTSPGHICVYVVIDIPRVVIPSLSAKLIIDGETVPIWHTQVEIYRPIVLLYDVFGYMGDLVCSKHNLDAGIYELEVIRTAFPANQSYIIQIEVLEDGTVRSAR